MTSEYEAEVGGGDGYTPRSSEGILRDVAVDPSTELRYQSRKTVVPESEFCLLFTVTANSLDSDGLIKPNSVEPVWYNQDATDDLFTEALTGENQFDTILQGLGNEAIGICNYEIMGAQTFTEAYQYEMFRNVAAVQNFAAEDSSGGATFLTTTPSYYEAADEWRVEYTPEEVQGLIDRFGGVPGSTFEEVISEKMRSLAIEVLQTFPSRDLHFSKAKSLMLRTSNLAAFAVSEGDQNVTLSLERMGADYGSSA